MADLILAERAPFAHLAGPSRLGDLGHEPGVTLRAEPDLHFTLLVANRNQVADVRRAAQSVGIALPTTPAATRLRDGVLLWSGPEQWLVAAGRSGHETLVRACEGLCLVVDQSDARAAVSVSGSKARAALAKGFAIDLHPRAFKTGDTALAPVAGIAAQIWQTDDNPTYMVAVPRSYAESFWRWLVEAAAEYGYAVVA